MEYEQKEMILHNDNLVYHRYCRTTCMVPQGHHYHFPFFFFPEKHLHSDNCSGKLRFKCDILFSTALKKGDT